MLRRRTLIAGVAAALALAADVPVGGTPASSTLSASSSPLRRHDDVLNSVAEYDAFFKGPGQGHQHGQTAGHLPASRRNVELVGKLRVRDAAPGRIADVASLGNFAYLGAFGQPSCLNTGVYVIDISDPRRPREAGFIPTSPGSYVGEGVQALRLNTASFRGDLLVHNNESCASSSSLGGMSLWDVRNPREPVALARHVGDSQGGIGAGPNDIHSVFAWQQGRRAFAALVDDEEVEDLDIFEITNPRAPRQIAEVGLPEWPGAQDAQSQGIGSFPASLHHDLQVRKIGGHWRMLVSYWDAGYIVLDVDDPAKPVFMADSSFPDPDRLTALSPSEGNAHYAEWDSSGRLILAADEDFDSSGLVGRITSGPFSGEQFRAPQGPLALGVQDAPVVGPTYWVGRACDPLQVPGAASRDAIAVIERGDCTVTEKANNVALRGYAGALVFNTRDRRAAAPICEGSFGAFATPAIQAVGVVPRAVGFKVLGIGGYARAGCPRGREPALPRLGSRGATVDIRPRFDGWGYLRLLDGRSLAEIDSYAIPQSRNARYADGSGDLTIHETATDPNHELVYVSWYSGGFRVVSFWDRQLREVGHFIDRGGNNFWGVQMHRTASGSQLVLASDRDSGLYIFRYVGPTSNRG